MQELHIPLAVNLAAVAIMVGTLASVGGLILADLLQGCPSSILHVGPPNAVAGTAGACAYTPLYGLDHPTAATITATAVTFLVRLLGRVVDVRLPRPRRHVGRRRQSAAPIEGELSDSGH